MCQQRPKHADTVTHTEKLLSSVVGVNLGDRKKNIYTPTQLHTCYTETSYVPNERSYSTAGLRTPVIGWALRSTFNTYKLQVPQGLAQWVCWKSREAASDYFQAADVNEGSVLRLTRKHCFTVQARPVFGIFGRVLHCQSGKFPTIPFLGRIRRVHIYKWTC